MLTVALVGALAQVGMTQTLEGVVSVTSSCQVGHPTRPHHCRQDILLSSGGRGYRLSFPNDMLRALPPTASLTGRYWRLRGRFSPNRSEFQVERWFEDSALSPKKADVSIAAISKPYLVVLARYSDHPSTQPQPASYYQTAFGSSAPFLNHYFTEQSYSTINLNGTTVVGWVNLPNTMAFYFDSNAPSGPDYMKVSDAVFALLDPTIDFSQYDGVNIILNVSTGDVGGRGGRLYKTLDGQTRTWGVTVNNPPTSWLLPLMAHEMGHSFGMDHSSGPYSTNYDSYWDQMSNGSNYVVASPTHGNIPTHTNAYHRMVTGWLPNSRIYEAYPGTSLTVKLKPIAEPGASGFAAARVWKGSGQEFYTVEYRKNRTNYDTLGNANTGLPGEAVVIHDVDEFRTVVSEFDGSISRDRNSRVVDPENDGDPNDANGNTANDAQWKAGETYTDVAKGITIRVNSITAAEADVTITVSSALAQPNWVTSTADSGPGSLRGAMNYFVRVPEAAATKSVAFRIPTSDPGYAGGVWTIKPLIDLDMSGTGVTVDGATQAAFAGNTNPNGPEIVIDGSDSASSSFAFRFSGSNNTLKGVTIHSMVGPAIWIHGLQGGGDGNVVRDCYVGTNAAGTAAKPSGQNNIAISDAADNNRIENCLVSGSASAGISFYNGVSGNQVLNCKVGVNATGTAAVPNTYAGIGLYAGTKNSVISGNLASGNLNQGIALIGAGTTGNVVTGNICGLNATQTAAIPNTYQGIVVVDGANSNRIGGPTLAERNIIAGNSFTGIWSQLCTGTIFQNNYIGCNASGVLIANVEGGVNARSLTSNSFLGNVIVGGQYNGFYLAEAGSTGNLIEGNTIGFLPNGQPGPFAYDALILHNGPSGNTIRGNLIGHGSRSILILSDAGQPVGVGNEFRSNRLVGSFYQTVDLAGDGLWGVTPNDNLDGDTGPNRLQNFPILSSVVRTNAGTRVTGSFNSTPNRTFTLEFFGSGAPAAQGSGPGEWPFGTIQVTTNASGNASFTADVSGAVGTWITSNATDNTTKDTSEFSSGLTLANGLALLTVSPNAVDGGQSSQGTVEFGANVTSATVVTLGSNNAAAQVPSSTTVAAGTRVKTFNITTSVVTTDTNVTLTASYGGLTKSSALLVRRVVKVSALSLANGKLVGGSTTMGTITLTGAARTGGFVATVTSDHSNVIVPASVTISAGQLSGTFSVSTVAVTGFGNYTITASGGGDSKTATLSLTPSLVQLRALTLSPTAVTGGNSVTGTITLDRAASANFAVSVQVRGVGVSAPATVTVPAGSTIGTFTVTTSSTTVTRSAVVTISRGQAGLGQVLSASLTINP